MYLTIFVIRLRLFEEEKRREQDRRQRWEDLEEEYDEIDGIEAADY